MQTMMYHASRASPAVFALLGSWSGPSIAQPVQIIAEYSQRAPGDSGNFRIFSTLENSYSPAISGENVAFGAVTDGGSGIYAFIDGELRLVADTKTEIPGTSVHFGFSLGRGSGPSISGRNVVFVGVEPLVGSAIWLWKDGVLTKLVDSNTPVPGGTGTFGNFSSGGATPAISGDNVAFNALSDQGSGIYAVINGELRVIADTNTLLPGATQNATSFRFAKGVSPGISGENVAFYAVWGFDGEGLYLYSKGEIRVIADRGTPKPGGGTFAFRLDTNTRAAISGENVAFADIGGVFAYIDGSLRLIANSTTPGPNGGAFGTRSVSASIDGENIAFSAWEGDVGWGVFSYVGGEFRRIASVTTPIPGFSTTFFSFGVLEGVSPAISGEKVVFMGRGRPGIYVGDGLIPPIPTSSPWGLVVVTLLLLVSGSIVLTRRQTSNH